MAMEEACAVIESLESANETLKSQLMNSMETRSKADVLSLHNDKIIVSMEALRMERDEAVNLKQVAEARVDKMLQDLTSEREEYQRERQEWQVQRGHMLERFRQLKADVEKANTQLLQQRQRDDLEEHNQDHTALESSDELGKAIPAAGACATQKSNGKDNAEPGGACSSANVELDSRIIPFHFAGTAERKEQAETVHEGVGGNVAAGALETNGQALGQCGRGGKRGSWADLSDRLQSELSFHVQANTDLKMLLDQSTQLNQSLMSKLRALEDLHASSSPKVSQPDTSPLTTGSLSDAQWGEVGSHGPNLLDVSMQEQIQAERENVHFLSGSLSELTRAHALELLKLESSRAHCEELAVELNERLTQREAEIELLRQALAKAKLANFASQAEQKSACASSPPDSTSGTSSPAVGSGGSRSAEDRAAHLKELAQSCLRDAPNALKKRAKRKIELEGLGNAGSSDCGGDHLPPSLGESVLDRAQMSERRSSEIKEQVSWMDNDPCSCCCGPHRSLIDLTVPRFAHLFSTPLHVASYFEPWNRRLAPLNFSTSCHLQAGRERPKTACDIGAGTLMLRVTNASCVSRRQYVH